MSATPPDQDNYPRRYEYPPFAFQQPTSNNLSWILGIVSAVLLFAILGLFMYVQSVRAEFQEKQGDLRSAQQDVKRTIDSTVTSITRLETDVNGKLQSTKEQVTVALASVNNGGGQVNVGTIVALQNQIQAFRTELDSVKSDVMRVQSTSKDVATLSESQNAVIQRLNALQRVYLNLQAQVREASVAAPAQPQYPTSRQNQQQPILMDDNSTFLNPNQPSASNSLFPRTP